MILIAATATALASTTPARGQLVISGGHDDGSVIIDQSVLDDLGPARTLPQLLGPDAPPAIATPPVKLKAPKIEKKGAAASKSAKQNTATTQPPTKVARDKPAAARTVVRKAAKPTVVPAASVLESPKATSANPPSPPQKIASPSDAVPQEAAAAMVAAGAAPTRDLQKTAATSDAALPVPAGEMVAPPTVAAEPAAPPAATGAAPVMVGQPTAPAPVEGDKSPRPADESPAAGDAAPLPLTAPTVGAANLPASTPSSASAPRGLVPPPPVPAIASVVSVPPPTPVVPVSASDVGGSPGIVERNGRVSVLFSPDQAELPTDARHAVEALAQRLDKDPSLYLQLIAYAEGSEADASKARRLSLSRALSVRSYLMNYGLRSTRIDVRALGNTAPDAPLDRVDLMVEKR